MTGMFLRSGLGGIIVLCAIVYFSGAGSWLVNRVQVLDEQCYAMLNDIGFTEANPLCGAIASGLTAMSELMAKAGDEVHGLKQRVLGTSDFADLTQFTTQMQSKIAGLTSSSDNLAWMLSAGPKGISGSGMQPFQQAIDSFTIGQNYLYKDGMSAQERVSRRDMG